MHQQQIAHGDRTGDPIGDRTRSGRSRRSTVTQTARMVLTATRRADSARLGALQHLGDLGTDPGGIVVVDRVSASEYHLNRM